MVVMDIISRLKYFENRRKYPRVLLDLPFEYRTEYSRRIRGGIVIDACEVGFLIHSTENMLVGTRLKIAVLYPEEYRLAKLTVVARIVWKRFDRKEKRYLYGLKFNGILADDDYKLKGLLRSNSESPSPRPERPS
jgi:PilZ domain